MLNLWGGPRDLTNHVNVPDDRLGVRRNVGQIRRSDKGAQADGGLHSWRVLGA